LSKLIHYLSSIENPLVHHWQKLRSKSAYRNSEKRILLEGKNAIVDVARKIPPLRLIISEGSRGRVATPDIQAKELFLITERLMARITGVENPAGIVAEFPMPEMQVLKGRRILACDRLQDPGNLGTLMRTALAFGWHGLFLINSCDPFNDKVLRSAKGATFFLPLQKGDWDDLRKLSKNNDLRIILSKLEGKPPAAFHKEEALILLLGNEAKGVCPPIGLVHDTVTIPISPEVDSLNVAIAGAILMYELREDKHGSQ
jgi:TrmH family RNA methyltransferase